MMAYHSVFPPFWKEHVSLPQCESHLSELLSCYSTICPSKHDACRFPQLQAVLMTSPLFFNGWAVAVGQSRRTALHIESWCAHLWKENNKERYHGRGGKAQRPSVELWRGAMCSDPSAHELRPAIETLALNRYWHEATIIHPEGGVRYWHIISQNIACMEASWRFGLALVFSSIFSPDLSRSRMHSAPNQKNSSFKPHGWSARTDNWFLDWYWATT